MEDILRLDYPTTPMDPSGHKQSALRLQSIPKLETKKDWQHWNKRMMDFLLVEGFGFVVKEHPTKPQGDENDASFRATLKRWEDLQQEALFAIKLCCGRRANAVVKKHDTVAGALEGLRRHFGYTASADYYQLCRELLNLRLENCKNIDHYSSEMARLWVAINSIGQTGALPEAFINVLFLEGLGDGYDKRYIPVFPSRF
ncbi:hypothetical protein Q7P37_002376 [Cladosporium fusiforme]